MAFFAPTLARNFPQKKSTVVPAEKDHAFIHSRRYRSPGENLVRP
jgi:hypothetical protein